MRGPGTVTFGNANAVDTTASFSAAGTYVLRLTANDGALTAATTSRSPSARRTRRPWSTPGRTRPSRLPATATLDGTVTDDGLPQTPAR